jgi:hypothetical protein
MGLVAVLLAACAPQGTSTRSPEAVSAPPNIVGLTATPALDLTATPASTVQPIATSRGPNLEAVDPTTVSLASGSVQFIEFFRFT